MDNKAALRPAFFTNIPSLQKPSEPDSVAALTDDETFLAAMAQTAGWQTFTTLADRLISDLDKINDTAITEGATREQVGDNAIVISLTKGILRQLLNRVADAKEAADGTSK